LRFWHFSGTEPILFFEKKKIWRYWMKRLMRVVICKSLVMNSFHLSLENQEPNEKVKRKKKGSFRRVL